MCDDDFSDDFEGEDGFIDNDPLDSGDQQDETPDEGQLDEYYGPDLRDWMIIGPMSEEIAEEERRKERLQKELDQSHKNSIDGDIY